MTKKKLDRKQNIGGPCACCGAPFGSWHTIPDACIESLRRTMEHQEARLNSLRDEVFKLSALHRKGIG